MWMLSQLFKAQCRKLSSNYNNGTKLRSQINSQHDLKTLIIKRNTLIIGEDQNMDVSRHKMNQT